MGISITTDIRLSSDWVATLAEVCSGYTRVLILVSEGGRARGTLDAAERALADVETMILPYAPVNPSVERLTDLYGHMDLQDFNAIVAVGGGSVIDSAKAIAVARSSMSSTDFETRLTCGSSLTEAGDFDVVAVPTTAGTGSEVTPFATIWDTKNMKKYSISGNFLQPTYAVIDSSLLKSLNGDELLYPALDAVSHATESLWSRNATHQSRLYAATALSRLSLSVGSCATQKADFERLTLGSLYAGLAIAQSRTAIAHSISYPLTLRFGVPHGLACSFTLSAVHDHLSDCLGAYCAEIEYIERMLKEVRGLNLGQRIASYLSLADAQHLVGEMMTPGRGDNCVLTFEPDAISKVLAQGYS